VIRLVLVLATVGAIAAASTALAGPAAAPTLNGVVGPGFTITLTKAGKRPKTLAHGRYTFVIRDKAAIHNFTIERESGGTFERQLTTVPFVGTKRVTITLAKGKWKFYCKAHESTMFGFFTVK
jgi:hypothetical protein